jgi:hypothetical protein
MESRITFFLFVLYSRLVVACATMHGTGAKTFHVRNTKIKFVPWADVYAIGLLDGKETEYLSDWLETTDLTKAGLPELGDLENPGRWLTDFHEIEDKPEKKQRKLRFFRVADSKIVVRVYFVGVAIDPRTTCMSGQELIRNPK